MYTHAHREGVTERERGREIEDERERERELRIFNRDNSIDSRAQPFLDLYRFPP